jgi:hypothetical protein
MQKTQLSFFLQIKKERKWKYLRFFVITFEQISGQKWSYDSHLKVTFVSNQSLHWIPSWLVSAEIKCTLNVALPKCQ